MPDLARPDMADTSPSIPHVGPAPEFDVRTARARQRQRELIADADADRLGAIAARHRTAPAGVRGRVGQFLVTAGTWLLQTAEPVESRDPHTA